MPRINPIASIGLVEEGPAVRIPGFSSRSESQGWGSQTGTFIYGLNDETGGSMAFRRDNPKAGQMSLIIDGSVYVNEGGSCVISDNMGTNVTGGTSNDTMPFWRGQPSGHYWFTAAGQLNGQPATYGHLLHIHQPGSSEIFQIFKIAPNGGIYHRGSNGSTGAMPGWTAM